LPGKLRAYEAVYWLNRCFQAALLSLERLEGLGMFRLEYLHQYKIQIEYTRAHANQELTETLNQQEVDDGGRFDRMRHEYEKRYGDPDDVLFLARERRQEIKEQIRKLQKGLERERPRRQARSARKKQKRVRK